MPPITLDDVFARMLVASAQASVMAAVIWLVTTLAGRWISARWQCLLWSLVFIRLVLPALPPSPLSLMNFAPPRIATAAGVTPMTTDVETVTFGVIGDAVPAPVSAPARPQNGPAQAWLAVAAILLIRRVIAYIWLARKIRRLAPHHVHGMRAVETSLVSSPGVFGIFRPTLLLPPGLIGRLSPEAVRLIVLHESAHVRRGDLLLGAVASLITTIHWFNPIVWLAAARFRVERELACDDAVLTATTDRRAYGATILRLLELAGQHRQPAGVVGVLSSGRRAIRRRIASIAGPAPRRSPLGPIVLVVIAITLMTAPRDREAVAREPVTTTVQPEAKAQASDDDLNTTTRVYDVRDLLTDIPDFTPPDFEPAPLPTTTRAVASDAPATRPTTQAYLDRVNRLMADITGSIDPMSWRNNAGTVGSIRELQGQLIVTQTPRNQARILEELQTMRGARGVQVNLETRIINGVDAEAVLGERGWPRPPASNPAGRSDMWPRFLSRADVNRILWATQKGQKSSLITAPRITLFNGQRAFVLVSRQTAYVADLTKNPPGAKDEYTAVIKTIPSGVLIDARASVVKDDDGGGKYVTLMLNPRLSTLLELRPERWPGAPSGRDDLTIQVPHTLVTHLQTNVTIPDGQTAMYRIYPKREPPGPTTNPAERDPQPAIVLVKPTIVEPALEPPKEFPLISTRLRDGGNTTTPSPATRPHP